MPLRLVLLFTVGCLLAGTAAGPERAPVLVELFTSEGCSSCPPADRLLEVLDPAAIVLSEHVDYWDHQGWRDPFSDHANTLRQESYARRIGSQGPYTPQMIVDGAVEFVGNDSRRAVDEVARASKGEKVPVHLSRTAGGLQIETGPVPHSTDVLLAIAEDNAASQVLGGENKGRRLHHVAILRQLKKVGSVKRGSPFTQTIRLPASAEGKRLIVFLQDSDLGRVAGAGLLVP